MMIYEIIIAAGIVGSAVFILYRNLKNKSANGGCNCGSCSSNCPHHKIQNKKK